MSRESDASALSREASKYESAKEREAQRFREEQLVQQQRYYKMLEEYEEKMRVPLGAKVFMWALGIFLVTGVCLFLMSLSDSGRETFDLVMKAILRY